MYARKRVFYLFLHGIPIILKNNGPIDIDPLAIIENFLLKRRFFHKINTCIGFNCTSVKWVDIEFDFMHIDVIKAVIQDEV